MCKQVFSAFKWERQHGKDHSIHWNDPETEVHLHCKASGLSSNRDFANIYSASISQQIMWNRKDKFPSSQKRYLEQTNFLTYPLRHGVSLSDFFKSHPFNGDCRNNEDEDSCFCRIEIDDKQLKLFVSFVFSVSNGTNAGSCFTADILRESGSMQLQTEPEMLIHPSSQSFGEHEKHICHNTTMVQKQVALLYKVNMLASQPNQSETWDFLTMDVCCNSIC